MYGIYFSGSFKKDIKRCEKRRLDMGPLKKAVRILEKSGKLPAKYKPHKLKGRYNGFWECHIKPDWLMIWAQDDQSHELHFDRTGSHSDLF